MLMPLPAVMGLSFMLLFFLTFDNGMHVVIIPFNGCCQLAMFCHQEHWGKDHFLLNKTSSVHYALYDLLTVFYNSDLL